jgi:DNA-binding transcriptional LysR family regulator
VSQVQLSGVEVRHLQALQSVVEEGSFRVAADRLGYTQGSISAQIGALEKMIGRPLLERAPGRPVRLTAAGEAFLPYALDALSRLRVGADEADSADTATTRLRLGTYPSVAGRLLPPLLARLADEHPDAEVELVESSSARELETAVEEGRLDVAFAVQPFARPGVEGVALLEDPFCLVVPCDHEFADRPEPVTLDELAECARTSCARGGRRATRRAASPGSSCTAARERATCTRSGSPARPGRRASPAARAASASHGRGDEGAGGSPAQRGVCWCAVSFQPSSR